MEFLRYFAYLWLISYAVEGLVMKKPTAISEGKERFEGLNETVSSRLFSTEQLSTVDDIMVEINTADDNEMTKTQLQLLLSPARPNKSFVRHRRSRRSKSDGHIAKWSPVQYYSVNAEKFIEIGHNGLKLSSGQDCNECDLEIAPFCQLFPHVLACPKTVNHLWIYDLIVIRSSKSNTFMCMDIEGKLKIQVSLLSTFNISFYR
jgi:hypothetical protein